MAVILHLAAQPATVARVRGEHGRPLAVVAAFRQGEHLLVLSLYPLPRAKSTVLLTPLSPSADDDAFESAEAGPPTPGDGDSEGASPQHLEQPLPAAGASLADLNDSADSSSALLEPPDPAQRGSAPATEAPSGGGHHSRSSLNTVV